MSNAQDAMRYLMSKHGLRDYQAAAMLGHGMQESGLTPWGRVGDRGTAFGTFQWRGNRFRNMKAFTGAGYKNLYPQLDFMMHEMFGSGGMGGGSEALAGRRLRAARNLEEAVAAGMHFERPAGYSVGNPRGGHGYRNRVNYARQILGGGGPAIQPHVADVYQVDKAITDSIEGRRRFGGYGELPPELGDFMQKYGLGGQGQQQGLNPRQGFTERLARSLMGKVFGDEIAAGLPLGVRAPYAAMPEPEPINLVRPAQARAKRGQNTAAEMLQSLMGMTRMI